ncbi:MAG: ABC transporter permease subunit [Novosphingobium sp.]
MADAGRRSLFVSCHRLAYVADRLPFDNPANPATMGNGSGRQAALPSLPLAPMAIGQSDMMPNYYKIGIRSKVEFMYDSEIESPWSLLNGHFDLSFVIVFLMPLLVFALCFNLLSSEREVGIQRMLLAQPLSIGTLCLGKLLPRAAILLLTATVLPMLLLFTFRPEVRNTDQIMPILSWVAIVLAYGGFWFALAFAVNALRLSSATNSLILIAAWTLLVLVVPVLLDLVAEVLKPAPSRTQLAIQTRAIEAENLRRYDDLFSGDYRYIADPASLIAKNGRIEIPPRTRASFLAKRDMDKRIDVVLDTFDTSLIEQQRVVDHLSLLSPSVIAYEAMTSLAGNDGRRYLTFRQNVSKFHDNWRSFYTPRI